MPYTVAVRMLCDFTARRGDLDLRFTPSPSAQEGIAGHQLVAARRGPLYETEISLQGAFGDLNVRGRADGYDPQAKRLEEIKTHRGDLAKQPANHRHLHWAQLKVYGWLLCESRGLDEIELSLVYFDIASQQETAFTETHTAQALREFFEARCLEFSAWAAQEGAHRASRDEALASLAFPHPAFRTGQRELAEAVYKGAATGRCVMAQAPTGIGKTMGTVFAMLKAAKPHGLDKVFYLTAKSTGRQLALDAAAAVRRGRAAFPLRVIELVARDKACEHRDKACHGDSCPLAKGFYARLPGARQECVASGFMDGPALREVALKHGVCPYYLGQEVTRWSDLVVGDYNYWFDGSAMLYAMTMGSEWTVGVLVDEAHNLIERARAMYSASITQADLRALRSNAPAPVKPALDKFNRAWGALRKLREEGGGALDALPSAFLTSLRQAGAALESHLAEAAPGAADGGVQQFYFDILAFQRLAESLGPHSVIEWSEDALARGKPAATLRIQNLIPAPFLKPRFAAARTVTLFSATLSPPRYYIDMLGAPDTTAWIDVASPFSADQLEVQVVSRISTRFAHRQRSAAPISKLIAAQFDARPGNYLAFFSSFDYLDMVAAEFQREHPAIPMWTQARGMDERARNGFLERFAPGGAGVGFAVLGGSFGEGIDLRGDRLVGAFVATLGLPQVNARNEQLKDCLEGVFGSGYDYTYLYPGIQKVVQAAGRVIRTQEDKGIVYLIDDRFARPAVRELLPAWWRV
ncbi:ATP-dependent DNA helicase [Caenimonas aquaedulcis]|uniref:ATP-dependent DNA helicase n=1 Tax=Caenimonas aquaedulcis TaxID=2793270 RepID=A0A931H7L5_9BURK|nr:ATP-dependent DNA helicase [Caenimonas aquaedulcis]MBG9390175.1 ATP-dependent DNA helicase [Caenimonas aquaedulcis]